MPFWTETDWGGIELAPPFLTYESGVRVYVDDLACEARHVGIPAVKVAAPTSRCGSSISASPEASLGE